MRSAWPLLILVLITPCPAVANPPPAQDTSTAGSSRPSPSPGVVRACARIGPGDLIRMRGDFGEFLGFASVVGPEGMEGLRVDPDGGRLSATSVPNERVTWDRIAEVEKRGHAWRKGALIGGIVLGAAGAYIGYEGLGEQPKGTTKEKIGDAAIGFGALGAIGAVLGAGVGWLVPAWQRVYLRPEATGTGR